MTPETPDPPPVSPDPWKDVRRFDMFAMHGHDVEPDYGPTGDYMLASEVDAARAADALRHQQETADLTRAVQGNALAVVKASAEGGSQIADLRAALSTAEATIASLTAQVKVLEQVRDIAQAGLDTLRAERDALKATVTSLETELDATSAFIARATTGPDSPLNLAVDVEARAVKAEQERDAAQQESKRWEVHYNEKLLAEMEEFERAERAGKEAQTLREALAKADEALKRLMADQHDCGDPGTECPMHDAHKSWHPVSEALTLIAALTPRPQEPRP